MKYKIIAFAVVAALQTQLSNALSIAGSCSTTTCTGTEMETVNTCDSVKASKCYKTKSGKIFKVHECATCPSGTPQQVALNEVISECSLSTTTVQTCCHSCTNCTSDSTYTATGTEGYEHRTEKTCTCFSGCQTSYSYRCASGYYGLSLNGTSGCGRCPESDGVYGTSAAGSSIITDCYIPANTTLTDSSGTYTYTEKCPYSS